MIKDNVMENMANNRVLAPVQKIVLFVMVSFILELPQFINKLIQLNTGMGEIRYTRVILQVVPILYILQLNLLKRSVKLKYPHIFSFLLMILVLMLLERYLSHFQYEGLHVYRVFWNQLNIYIFFLMLVNYGLDRVTFYKAIDYSFYIGLFVCFITVIGYSGFIKMSFEDNPSLYVIGTSLTEAIKPSHALHVNKVSIIFALTILMLIIKQLNEKAFFGIYIFRDFAAIFLLCGMITVNASRGAILIALILVCYYLRVLFRYALTDIGIRGFVICVVILSATIMIGSGILLSTVKSEGSKVAIINRFKTDLTDERYMNMVRLKNMQSAWKNFLEHPITGVGYFSAAMGYDRQELILKSNNQYLQMLGAYGIFFFIIYIYYNYKLVVFRLYLLKRPEVALCLLFHALHSILTMPTFEVAILGYIAIYFYNESRSIYSGTNQINSNRIK